MRRALTIFLLTAYGLPLTAGYARTETESVLKEIETKAAEVKSYSADVKISIKGKDSSLEMAGKMLFKSPCRMKLDLDLPGGAMPIRQLTVCDGKTVWQYMKPMEIVYRHALKDLSELGDIRNATKDADKGTVRIVREDTLSGEKVYLMEAMPAGEIRRQEPSRYCKMEIYVAQADGLVRKVVIRDERGAPAMVQEYSNVKTNVQIDDKEFVFVAPAGAKVEVK